MQGRALVILTFWCLNISDECSNCCVFPSPFSCSLSLTHTHMVTCIRCIGRTILLHPHSYSHRHCVSVPVTRSFLPPLWGELTSPASCREHQPIYRSRVSRVERERERTERARDEEKREKGEKMLQLWSKCCTEPCAWWGMWRWTAALYHLFTQHGSFSSLVTDFDLFWARLDLFISQCCWNDYYLCYY